MAVLTASMLTVVVGCGDEEIEWEAARGAVGAVEGDQIRADREWRAYREGVVRSLDEMKEVLNRVRNRTGVDERGRVDALIERNDRLRQDMIAEFDVPRDRAEATRKRLASEFDGLRKDTNAFLVQHDVDPMEMKKWADIE